MKLFGLKSTSVHVRKAPEAEAGKYNIYEVALIDDDTNAVGSIGFAIRSDEMSTTEKEAEAPNN